MRLWVKPDCMAVLGITADVRVAVETQNQQTLTGQIGAPPSAAGTNLQFNVVANNEITEAGSYDDMIARHAPNHSLLRLRDFGQAQLDVRTPSASVWHLRRSPCGTSPASQGCPHNENVRTYRFLERVFAAGRVLLHLLRFSFVLSLILVASSLFAQEVADMPHMLDGSMRPDLEVSTFEHSDRLYPVQIVHRGETVEPLLHSQATWHNLSFQQAGKRYDLDDYLAVNRVAGLLVLREGKIVLEDYELGATAATHWASFSMAKSITSTLIGIALRDGSIQSLDDSVTRYVPALRGGVYDAVSIRNVLQMASGVRWNETYTDPNSDCRRLTNAQSTHKAGASMAYMRQLSRAAPPGTVWNYNSGETNIAGAVVEGATGKSLARYLSEKVWSPLGMEEDATWWTESPGGLGLGGVGLAATLRDYARFGLFVLNDGLLHGTHTVPPGWFQEAGKAHIIGGKHVDYGYQWWPTPPGDSLQQGSFEAKGIFGQHLYINPREKLVIVVLSARSKPTGATVIADSALFQAIASTLHREKSAAN